MKLDWLEDQLRSDVVKCKSEQERPERWDKLVGRRAEV